MPLLNFSFLRKSDLHGNKINNAISISSGKFISTWLFFIVQLTQNKESCTQSCYGRNASHWDSNSENQKSFCFRREKSFWQIWDVCWNILFYPHNRARRLVWYSAKKWIVCYPLPPILMNLNSNFQRHHEYRTKTKPFVIWRLTITNCDVKVNFSLLNYSDVFRKTIGASRVSRNCLELIQIVNI